MFKKHSRNKHYWFTIVAANGQTLATSETYTTAAMRDKGIEAVKKVVREVLVKETPKVKVSKAMLKDTDRIATVISGRDLATALRSPRRPADIFHIENKKGKIVKR